MPSLTLRHRKIILLAGVVLAGTIAVIVHGPIPQPEGYHLFADHRTIFGIPNFWNVVSNLPFLAVGLAGFFVMRTGSSPGVLPALRPAYFTFFLGTVLVAFGSGYYHLTPSDDSLVWDRLPMTITFMAFLAILIGEHIGPAVGARLLLPFLAVGLLSIAYWRFTDDLRPYVLVQFLPMLLAPLLLLLFPSALTRPALLWSVLVAYAVAKVFEELDDPIYRIIRGISGHSLKHIIAAAGTYFVVLAVTKRGQLTRH